MAGQQPGSIQKVQIAISNAASSSSSAFQLDVTLQTTVGELKRRLQQEYPGNPQSDVQRLVYAGKVLKEDAACLVDVLPKDLEPGSTHTVYLALKTVQQSAQPVPSLSSQPPASSVAGSSGPLHPEQAPVPPTPAVTPAAHVNQASSSGHASSSTAADQGPHKIPVPPQFIGNPAMTAAFNAALTALRQIGPVEPPANQTPSSSGLPGFPGGVPYAYMPMILAPPTLDSGNQSASQLHVHYAPVQLAPILPVMVPYGVPYLPYGYGTQPPVGQPAPHPQPAPAPLVRNVPGDMQFNLFANLGVGRRGLVAAAGAAPPGGAQPGIPGAGAPGVGPGAQPARVAMVRVNIRVLLQTLVLAIIIYKNCPPGRFFLVAGGAILLYLTGLAPLRAFLNRALGLQPPRAAVPAPPQRAAAPPPGPVAAAPVPAANAAGAPAEAAAGAPAAAAAAAAAPAAGAAGAEAGAEGGRAAPPAAPLAQDPARGLLREIQAVIVGFFTSLLPGWNINPEDAAAFAVAQQAAVLEGERRARDIARDHQD